MTHRSAAVLGAATVAAAASLASAAPASAAGYTCEATGPRIQLGPTPAVEPITANKGQATCQPARGGGASVLPPPIGTSALFAETTLTGTDPKTQVAGASAGLADLRIGPGIDLGIQQAVDQALAPIPPITIPAVGTLDLRRAVVALLQPSSELIRIQAAAAYAKAQCDGGQVSLTGTTSLAKISVLGTEIPTDELLKQTVNVVGGGSINLAQLDPAKLLPPGITLDPLLESTIKGILATLPRIEIPRQVIEVRITPAEQIRTANTLTQRALQLKLSLAGQQLLDLSLGEATVGSDAVDCVGTPPRTATRAALQCTSRRLVLTDVYQSKGRVQLTGAADRKFIGKTVDIHFVPPFGAGPKVATATVQQDGSFKTTAKLPARKIRGTNRARYQARIGNERSLRLKLQRRMVVRSVKMDGGKVQISGRVARPLANPTKTIEVRQRVSCQRWKIVKRIKPKSDGTWTTTVDAPPTSLAGTYRFTTQVRKNRKNPKLFPTFTLPRYIETMS